MRGLARAVEMFVVAALAVGLIGCGANVASSAARSVPHQDAWGIYSLRLDNQEVRLLFSSQFELTGLALNPAGDRFAYAQNSEIYSVSVAGGVPSRLTDNGVLDTYPAWSPDGKSIAFLRMGKTLDVWVMGWDGSGARLLYDSGGQDADISWVGDRIAFTRDSQVWTMKSDGTGAKRLTSPPRAGEWGKANLPFGDYDPRISPDGTRVVFERLVGDSSPNGNYDMYVVGADGSGAKALTSNGWTQGLAAWSRSGSRIAYIVAAKSGAGAYDIYSMAADGTDNRNVTPDWFPPEFLCHAVVFGPDDNLVYFVGEWWSA